MDKATLIKGAAVLGGLGLLGIILYEMFTGGDDEKQNKGQASKDAAQKTLAENSEKKEEAKPVDKTE